MSTNPSEDPWVEGINCFNQGQYWDAHEHWEQGWKNLHGQEKLYVQGLIQACAAFVHLEKGNTAPAITLARLALNKLTLSTAKVFVDVPGLKDVLYDILNTAEPIWSERPGQLKAVTYFNNTD